MARMAHADDFALSRVTPDAQKLWFGAAKRGCARVPGPVARGAQGLR